MVHFADRLDEAVRKKGNPVCVGLDPRFDQLPQAVRDAAIASHGRTPRAVAEALLAFNTAILDAVCDLVPVCKPQVAFYEEFGWEGMRAFDATIRRARERGLLVISDAKRGDIGATALSYARAHLGGEAIDGKSVGFDADALTVNPYMGRDTLQPYLDIGAPAGRGIFVLVKTSNSGSGDIQDQALSPGPGKGGGGVGPASAPAPAGGMCVYEYVAEIVRDLGEKHRGACGLTDVGAVVGATFPQQARRLRERMPDTIFLIPGYGAQGGSAQDAAAGFRDDGRGAIVNNSRGILFAFKNAAYAAHGEKDFAGAARAATLKMIEELRVVLGKQTA